ncbi:MbcA/ParS/Xre antitoxin family protein [Deinococcus hopiensis]|uniref:Antitoxin Xre/MbcA/ParS-like toxin-binding domain-containing protein n=1 Tax=Deinococcus hopiensis KR-140 TaxID=695939 RepID=A0A1W1UJ44_9DEIO|nr:Protein of unknown function [Deinococcus hopiensis KR-140]
MLGEDRTRGWLTQLNSHLDGKAPANLLRTETGGKRLSRYLKSLQNVTYG